ncbi:MAG: PRC-barrel domain-containing protein [Rhodospirillaceae bacterium]|nr:PRC-barrel domain-containing protein [Rhodospirillaceae bacterium]
MVKHTLAALSVAALIGAAPAMAAGTTNAGAGATAGTAASTTMPMGRAEAGKLIGQSVENTAGDRIGEVEAVNIGTDGKVTSVIVGVGGFLGVGERDVALGWKDLQITDNGGKVVANLSKSNLESMKAYKYSDPKHRGTVFEDKSR